MAIRRIRHTFDDTRMPCERLEEFTRRRIPKMKRVVPTPTGQRMTIRRIRHTFDDTRMPCERLEEFTRRRIPKTKRVIMPTSQRMTIR